MNLYYRYLKYKAGMYLKHKKIISTPKKELIKYFSGQSIKEVMEFLEDMQSLVKHFEKVAEFAAGNKKL